MDWIGPGPENWTHVQIWYVSHHHLVKFILLDYIILTDSYKTKCLLSKFPGGISPTPGTMPGIITVHSVRKKSRRQLLFVTISIIDQS